MPPLWRHLTFMIVISQLKHVRGKLKKSTAPAYALTAHMARGSMCGGGSSRCSRRRSRRCCRECAGGCSDGQAHSRSRSSGVRPDIPPAASASNRRPRAGRAASSSSHSGATSKTAASRVSPTASGRPAPFSQRPTACLVTPSFSARRSCDQPRPARSVISFSENVISSHSPQQKYSTRNFPRLCKTCCAGEKHSV